MIQQKATKTESVKDLLSVDGVNFQFPLPLSKEAKLLLSNLHIAKYLPLTLKC